MSTKFHDYDRRRWARGLVFSSIVALVVLPIAGAQHSLAESQSQVAQARPDSGTVQPDEMGDPESTPELSFVPEPCDADDDAIAHAQSLRKATGLASDVATVEASFMGGPYSCTGFGVPMTKEELREFGGVLDAQGELSNYAIEASIEPTFGGASFDADVLTIVSTDGKLGEAYRNASGSINSVLGKYTWKELKELAASLIGERQATKEYPFDIVRVSVNPRTNRVDVSVASDIEAATRSFADTYGDRVNVRHEDPFEMTNLACTVWDCGTKGGVAGWHWTPDNGCTTGFLVQAHKGSTAWKRYMYTAGHCIDETGGLSNPNPWQNWVGSQVWGTNKANEHFLYPCGGFSSCRNGDQGLFGLGPAAPASWNRYVTGSSHVAIDGATIDSNQFVGQVVWRHGLASGWKSGAITEIPTYVSCGLWCYDYGLVAVAMNSFPGDSGAGFFFFYTSGGVNHRSAYGVLSGVPQGQTSPTYYSSYHSSLDSADGSGWHFQPCVSANCPLN